jgi:hypothetical protein
METTRGYSGFESLSTTRSGELLRQRENRRPPRGIGHGVSVNDFESIASNFSCALLQFEKHGANSETAGKLDHL